MILVNDNNPLGARGMARHFQHALDGIIAILGNQTIVFSHLRKDYGPARYIHAFRYRGSEQIALHEKLATLVVWRTHPAAIFSAWFTTIPTSTPQAFVVYDLILERFPHFQSRLRVPLRNLIRERKHSLERADMLIAISQSTARDITAFYPHIDPAKIVVTPLGVDTLFFDTSESAHERKNKPYMLYVGFRTNHKNYVRFLTAYGQSGLSKYFDLRVISQQPFCAEEVELMRRYKLHSSIQRINNISDVDLCRSYRESVAFVYPSIYEGFGLPILEAMASGTIIVTSNTSSMPEVGGDVALYFDPYNTDDIADGLRRAVNLSSEEREWRIADGIARARTFTWERCQQQTVAAIRNLSKS